MRLLIVALLAASTSPALADRIIVPKNPPPPARAAEQPCDKAMPRGDLQPMVGRYMCQIGQDGAWAGAYPCEIVAAPRDPDAGYDWYLRFAQFNLTCDVVGTLTGGVTLAFDGSLSCTPRERDVIGHEAVFTARLRPVAGGFRLESAIDMVKTRAHGSPDAIERPTTLERRRTAFTMNICRRPWPAHFESDVP